jgi:hypothetical protein
VTEEKEYRRSYSAVGSKSEDLNHSLVSVHSYRGENSNPQWRMDEPGAFALSVLRKKLLTACHMADQYVVECKVEADVSMVKRQYCTSTVDGRLRDYCEIEFDVVLLFGLTELKAQIAYMENVSDSVFTAALRHMTWLMSSFSVYRIRKRGMFDFRDSRRYRRENINLTYPYRGPATVIYDDEEEGTGLWGSSRRGLPHN